MKTNSSLFYLFIYLVYYILLREAIERMGAWRFFSGFPEITVAWVAYYLIFPYPMDVLLKNGTKIEFWLISVLIWLQVGKLPVWSSSRLWVKMEVWVNTAHLLTPPQKKLQLDYKTSTNRNHQKIKLNGSPVTKELKNHFHLAG